MATVELRTDKDTFYFSTWRDGYRIVGNPSLRDYLFTNREKSPHQVEDEIVIAFTQLLEWTE